MTRLAPLARTVRFTRLSLVSLAATALVACGGGGASMPPPAALPVTLSVQPTTVVAGQNATLTWTAPSTASCTASGGWAGTQTASGAAVVVAPSTAGSVTYTLSCTASGGAYGGGSSGAQSAMLTVTAASGFTATALVADSGAGGALVTDPSLVNPWGIAFGPGAVWVANNHSENSTLYDGNGKAQPTAAPLIVALPASATSTAFDPTGIVFNSTASFVVSAAGKSGAAKFLFAGEGGMLAGWTPAVDAAHGIVAYTDAGGAVYKGLAIANDGTADFLYATDFHNARVDVFDLNFARQVASPTRFAFIDPNLPAGYAPFGIQALKTGAAGAVQLYVSYAEPAQPDLHDNVNGAGLGLVDVYDADGVFIRRLVSPGDRLNAPWGLALAPADFGTLSGTVLVGNFGDGKINGYNAVTGAFAGTVASANGTAFAAPGLWGLAFGNDAANQPHNTLFYAAGTNNEANGVYGRIDLGGAPVLNAAPVVTLAAPAGGGVTGTVTLTGTASASVGIAKLQFFANGTLIGTATTAPYSVQWDSTTSTNAAAVQLTVTATDVDGNVGSSPAVSVTVGTMTLAQLQASVFTPRCSGCHTGVGTTLPGVQNLTDGNTFASVVGVTSLEQPTLQRIAPGNVAASYLIQKVEGAGTISGVRMPAGGPYLDQATIDQIKTWINNGAPNN